MNDRDKFIPSVHIGRADRLSDDGISGNGLREISSGCR